MPPDPKAAAATTAAHDPRPTLGPAAAFAITIGIVVGAGIFRTPSLVAGASSSGAMMLVAWLVGGALSVVGPDANATKAVQSQVKRLIRANYSSPPSHGAMLVSGVLNDPALKVMWEQELGEMRTRIHALRAGLVARLDAHGAGRFGFINDQAGMFSYSGLSREQVDRLRDEFGIYAVGTGRICVAALNKGNLDSVTRAIHAVL